MTKETLTPEQFEQELEKLVNMHKVDSVYDMYGRYKTGKFTQDEKGNPIREDHLQRTLGSIISPTDPDLFLMETQSFLERQVEHYQGTRAGQVEEAGNKIKDKLTSDYATLLNSSIDAYVAEKTPELKEAIDKNPKLKALSEDRKKELIDNTIATGVYDLIGSQMANIEIDATYEGNKALKEASERIKRIRKASPDEKHEMIADEVINADGLDSSYKLARRPWDNIGGDLLGMSIRVLGKHLVDEKDGKYTVKEGQLKEAYSATQSLKGIASAYDRLRHS